MEVPVLYILTVDNRGEYGVGLPMLEASINSLVKTFDFSSGDTLHIYLKYSGLNMAELANLRILASPALFSAEYIGHIVDADDYRKCWVKKIRLQSMMQPKKVMYLDVDTIVRGDIRKWYNDDLDEDGYDLSGCTDIALVASGQRKAPYVYSGAILYKPESFRNFNLDKLEQDMEGLEYPDQDFINGNCKVKVLPANYHACLNLFSINVSLDIVNNYTDKEYNSLTEFFNDGLVVHYPISARPFSSRIPNWASKLWYGLWDRLDRRTVSFKNAENLGYQNQYDMDFFIQLDPTIDNMKLEFYRPQLYTCRSQSDYVVDLQHKVILDRDFTLKVIADLKKRPVDLTQLTLDLQ